MAKSKKPSAISFFEDFGLLLLSIGLFVGGIHILSLAVAFWSLFLGIASIQIGIVLVILTFDAFIKRKTKPTTDEYKTLACLVCRKATFVPKYAKTAVCDSCQVKIATIFKGAVVVIFGLIGLSVSTLLAGQKQQFAKKALVRSVKYQCEQGDWTPLICTCGKQDDHKCPEGSVGRECVDGKSYCCFNQTTAGEIKWRCELR